MDGQRRSCLAIGVTITLIFLGLLTLLWLIPGITVVQMIQSGYFDLNRQDDWNAFWSIVGWSPLLPLIPVIYWGVFFFNRQRTWARWILLLVGVLNVPALILAILDALLHPPL